MRIAVVGSGIAGMGATWALSRAHEVELFERDERPGGHTNTVLHDGLALDTGFIVLNEPNYPRLVRLFRELGVRTQDSEMSFSVSCRRCGLEYSGRRPFAQPANLVRPAFLGLLGEITRFLRSAGGILGDSRYQEATLADYVEAEGYSQRFRDHYLVPLTAAIWSTAPERALDFPAVYAVRFFDNHGMLGFRRHQWKTIAGGSREYVRAIVGPLEERLRLGSEVRTLTRHADGVDVRTADGEERRFDKAVVAAHPDEALALLADPSEDERRILGAFTFTRNETVLHTDQAFLPQARAARAAWNYQIADCRSPSARPTVTYYLNRLQRLDEPEHYCVTLNRSDEIREDRVIQRFVYHHPLYTMGSLHAQAALPRLNGARHTVYCGAYHGFGFHEDGLVSGLAAARALGVEW